MEKKKLNWFSMKAVAFHFDGNLKKNLTFSWKILMENFDGKKKKAQLVQHESCCIPLDVK